MWERTFPHLTLHSILHERRALRDLLLAFIQRAHYVQQNQAFEALMLDQYIYWCKNNFHHCSVLS